MPEAEQKTTIYEELPESIELTRNTKGYGWVIKLRAREKLESELLERLSNIDAQLRQKFGGEPS